MEKKRNNTLIIVLAVIAVIGICCCGGFAIMGGQGMKMFGQMNAEYTAEVNGLLSDASAANWDVNAVSNRIYTGDGNNMRVESTRIVFQELSKLGSFTKVDGNMNGMTNNTVNGVNTQTFKWHGTATMTNGTSPLTVEMIKVGEAWQVQDIYLR